MTAGLPLTLETLSFENNGQSFSEPSKNAFFFKKDVQTKGKVALAMFQNLKARRSKSCLPSCPILLILILPIILLPAISMASQILLEFDPSSDPDVAGYRVYCREQNQAFDYESPCWEGVTTYLTIYNLDETKAYCFVARAFNTTGIESADSNTVCSQPLNGQNEPPIAVVTPTYSETTTGALVLLDGSASTDPDDGIASYLWSQIAGDPVALSDPTKPAITFIAPVTGLSGQTIDFNLTVTDHGGLTDTAEARVSVLPNNSPVADFGFTADGKKLIAFADNSTDSDGEIVSWLWDFGDGGTSTDQNPKHRYSKFGDYPVTLTVTDDAGASSSTTKSLTISK